ncbi:MAG TPA: tRNA(His) guanylyltransferase Thg1 family protein [Methanothermobacter sp.]|nr:conserved hypothetical protein [Methanothermobacter sp. MT-2]HHW05386.1 guanylyltransferase [Methanothermobacter sp.]HOK73141.1 tRNA(His) guanylyltransferase Thg1 family protein [Methanothermobacter sp.]HOL68773.1 tRNA(His) guanylyltransferase Thg1 family protein [Methanothermobacter sp.]HPQ04666.1 tRNA(His) guanylyltransferase Thg1 family protein [Methanothermobacter sp.]
MKECEIYSRIRVPCGCKTITRLDGRRFHRLTRELDFERPYDPFFADCMVETSIKLMREFSPIFIYTFSDEINILFDELPFNGRIEKLDSVLSSFTATSFILCLLKKFERNDIRKPISFDSRIIPIAEELLGEYFKSRQDEAWRNCLNSYAYWKLRETMDKKAATEKLRGLKSSDIHELLFEKGVNLARVPAWHRRGIGIYKRTVTIRGYDPRYKRKVESRRKKIIVDRNLPLFNKDFFKMIEGID